MVRSSIQLPGGGVIVLDCVGHEVERLGTTVQMNMCV